MIRALVFDFDGLIVDTESALIAAYAEVHAAHGVAFNEAEFIRTVGHADYDFDPWHAFEKRADRLQLEFERRERNRELDLHLPILPGVAEIVEVAEKRGLSIGLASNSVRAHCERHLARIGLLPRFRFLACREDVAAPKPAPDLYKLVLDRFGTTGPQTIAFEDSHSGSLAAKRAGINVVAVPNVSTRYHELGHADLVLQSLADTDLDALLARFSGDP